MHILDMVIQVMAKDMVDGLVMEQDIMDMDMATGMAAITVAMDMVMPIMASPIILIVTMLDMVDMIWVGSLGIIEDTEIILV